MVAAILLSAAFSAKAEDDTGAYGGYTPYSIFGFGDISSLGSAYTFSMGGVGIASRNHKFINPMNPAAVTARDSLAFMVDFSLNLSNKFLKEKSGNSTLSSANNTFNVGDCIISFPIYRSSAMMVGIMPYSSTGYSYAHSETDPKILSNVGNVAYAYSGQGAIYQAFAAAGVTFWKRLSIGVEGIYYFGNILKNNSMTFTDASYNGLSYIDRANINTFSAKFGLQYFQPVGETLEFGLGGTYKMSTDIRGSVTNNGEAGKMSPMKMPAEIGAGISASYDKKLTVEFDFLTSDWTKSGIEKDSFFSVNESATPFNTTVARSFRLGAEFVPDARDPRYYMKKVAFRAGVYYNNEYYNVGGNKIDAKGITLGATFPVFNEYLGWNTGLTVGFELGQRGSLANNLVKETYFNVSFAVNLYDRWFHKMIYE